MTSDVSALLEGFEEDRELFDVLSGAPFLSVGKESLGSKKYSTFSLPVT